MKSYYTISFGISLLTHALIIAGVLPALMNSKIPLHKGKQTQSLRDISEIKIIPQKKEMQEFTGKTLDDGISQIPLPYIDNFAGKIALDNIKILSLDKPQIARERIREVAIVDMPDKNLKKLPEYMDYYQLIRTKIGTTAQRLYDGTDRGSATLNFVVLSDGRLGSIFLEEPSASSSPLREIAIKSIHDAAPFPPFPKELGNRSTLPFNITINFKNN